MVRTQVYLASAQHRALKKEAARQGVSMTELLRRILDAHLMDRRAIPFSKERVMSFVALGESGRANTSERHDQALDEDLRGGAFR